MTRRERRNNRSREKYGLTGSYSEMPPDVQEVVALLCVQEYRGFIGGVETAQRVDRVIRDNPRWFPWEHKYARIPKEVHEAHNAEMVAYYSKIMLDMVRNDEPVTPESSYDPAAFDAVQFLDEINNLWRQEQEEKRQQERDLRAIWNKHYKPYKLEYRG